MFFGWSFLIKVDDLPFAAVFHIAVLFQNGENLVQRFVIYENRIIAFVGQLLAVDNDLHVKRAFELSGYIREPRIDERQVTVVYAVGERPAGEPHRRDAPRPFVDLDHVARSHLDLAVLLQILGLHVYRTRKQGDFHFAVIHIGTDPERGAVHQNIDVVGREHETALGILAISA